MGQGNTPGYGCTQASYMLLTFILLFYVDIICKWLVASYIFRIGESIVAQKWCRGNLVVNAHVCCYAFKFYYIIILLFICCREWLHYGYYEYTVWPSLHSEVVSLLNLCGCLTMVSKQLVFNFFYFYSVDFVARISIRFVICSLHCKNSGAGVTPKCH